MRKTFLVPSLAGRINGVFRLMESLIGYSTWDIDLILQCYPVGERAIIEAHAEAVFPGRARIYATEEMTGPHLARCLALDDHESDIWCILDDDMYALPDMTDYDKMAQALWEDKSIGILSSNWRRTDELARKVKRDARIVKQPIVYTGGGMMIRQDVADIIKGIPRTQYIFDNPLWSIYSYVSGYDNARYMGSVAVHQICTKGGRRKWIKETDSSKSLPPSEWIRTRRGKGEEGGFDEYLICDSSDITPLAKEAHGRNKDKLLFHSGRV